MRRIAATLSAVAVVLMTASVLAQTPNFTGKWTLEAPATPPAAPPAGGGGGRGGGRGGGLGQELTITQDAATLTLEYMGGGQNPAPMKLTFKLDGSESQNPGRGGAMQSSKAMWEAGKLVVTTTTQAGEQKRVFSMDGANLKVETTNPGFQGGAPTTTTATYKKS